MLFSFTGNRVVFSCAFAFMIIISVMIANGLYPLALRIALEKCAAVTPHFFCIKCHFMLTGIMSHQQLYKLPVQLLLSSQKVRQASCHSVYTVLSFPCKKIASMERIMSLFSNECGSV